MSLYTCYRHQLASLTADYHDKGLGKFSAQSFVKDFLWKSETW